MSNVRYNIEVHYFTTGKVGLPGAAQDKANRKQYDSARAYDKQTRTNAERAARIQEKLDMRDMRRAEQDIRKKEQLKRQAAATSRMQGRDTRDVSLAGLGVAGGLIGGFGSVVDTMGGMLIGGLTGAATVAGGLIASGIATTLKTGIGLADTMERAQISFAAMQKMQIGGSWRANSVSAAAAIEGARKDAAALPGEMTDILVAMKTIGTPGMQSGMSLDRVQKLGSSLVAMAEIEGLSPQVAATQAARILQGRMSGNNNFGLRLGIKDFKSVNKMDPAKRAAMLEKIIHEGAAPALEDFRNSWRGLTSTMSDNWKNVAKSFAGPLIGVLKGAMGRGLGWFNENEDKVHAWATTLGAALEGGFRKGEDFITAWFPKVLQFGDNLYNAFQRAASVFAPILNVIETKLSAWMLDPQLLDKIVDLGQQLAGLKLGVMGAQAGVGLGTSVMKGLSGAGPEAMALGGMGAMAAVVVMGMGGYGIWDVLTNKDAPGHEGATASAAHFAKNIEEIFGGSYGTNLRDGADRMGQALLAGADLATTAFLKLNDITTSLGESLNSVATALHIQLRTLNPTPPEGIDREQEVMPLVPRGFTVPDEDLAKLAAKAKTPPVHNTTIHKVEIKVNSNQDPNRVAEATADIIMNIARHPKFSKDALSNKTVR